MRVWWAPGPGQPCGCAEVRDVDMCLLNGADPLVGDKKLPAHLDIGQEQPGALRETNPASGYVFVASH